MRILLTVPSLDREFGGPSGKAFDLAHSLRHHGHEVKVIGCGRRDGVEGLEPLASFHGTPVPRTMAPLRQAVASADIVHLLGYRDPVGSAAAVLAAMHRTPYLLEPVGMYRRRLRSQSLKLVYEALIGHRLVHGAAAVVATSGLEAAELREDGIDPVKIRVRPNGISLDGVTPLPERGALRARVSIPAESHVVLALGRITEKKGLVHLLQALATLPGVFGLIAGPDGGDGTLQQLEESAERLGIGDRVKLLPGGLWEKEKAEALADADCFCLPSATENFGVAPAEAACVGVPVVVSDQCGIAEWLSPDASRIVPYGDVLALAASIQEVLENPELKQSASEFGPKLSGILDWDELARQQLDLYDHVLTGR